VTFFSVYTNGFIFYTLDGSTADHQFDHFITGSLVLSNSAVVQAMALSSDFTQSALFFRAGDIPDFWLRSNASTPRRRQP